MDSEELTRALERATSAHERRLLRAMESLRLRLTDALAGLPLRDGVLFDLDAALAPVSYTHLTLPTNREV